MNIQKNSQNKIKLLLILSTAIVQYRLTLLHYSKHYIKKCNLSLK